jgi:hypothetical protein
MATQVTWAEALNFFSSPRIGAVHIIRPFQIGATYSHIRISFASPFVKTFLNQCKIAP